MRSNCGAEKTLESPSDCKEIQPVHPKGTQSWIFIGRTDTEACHQMRTDSLEKTPMLGKIEGRRRTGWQRLRWLDGITDSMDMNLSKFRETVEDLGAWRAVVHGLQSQTWLRDCTTTRVPMGENAEEHKEQKKLKFQPAVHFKSFNCICVNA